jgi:hypothetical protein
MRPFSLWLRRSLHKIAALAMAEHNTGRFNGTILAVKTATMRFPIASMTNIVKHTRLQLEASVAQHLLTLSATCQVISIRQLLTHTSGLQNEPVKAYHVSVFHGGVRAALVAKDDRKATSAFNYNNVDYIHEF